VLKASSSLRGWDRGFISQGAGYASYASKEGFDAPTLEENAISAFPPENLKSPQGAEMQVSFSLVKES
jgi:hypothetical protein